ncbi:UNVERIFIED_ORG: hypothetical protein J3D59_001902 [Pseudomonas fluorescens]
MKRLLAVSYGVGVRKALLGVLVVVVPTMGIAYAQERVINKISKPAVIVVLSDGGFGLAFFQHSQCRLSSRYYNIAQKVAGDRMDDYLLPRCNR